MPGCIVVLSLMAFVTSAYAQTSPILSPQRLPDDVSPRVFEGQCGDYEGIYGPFDYRTATQQDKRVVEKWHLDKEIAIFNRGRIEGRTMAGSGSVQGDSIHAALVSQPSSGARRDGATV